MIFLTFNRPMFFIGPERNTPIQHCGLTIPIDSLPEIYSIIDEHLQADQTPFENARRQLYDYTFDAIENNDFLKMHLQKITHDFLEKSSDSIY